MNKYNLAIWTLFLIVLLYKSYNQNLILAVTSRKIKLKLELRQQNIKMGFIHSFIIEIL